MCQNNKRWTQIPIVYLEERLNCKDCDRREICGWYDMRRCAEYVLGEKEE